MTSNYQQEILQASLESREKEVIEYQVNIDNFKLAIANIGDDPDMQEFKSQLQDLLNANLREQKKAKVMLDVIRQQVG
jgi:hypothetical protein